MKKLKDYYILRFIFFGGINTLIGASVMFILFNVFNVSYWIASACDCITGGIVGFILNRKFTFSSKNPAKKEIIPYILGIASCYFIAYNIAKPVCFLIFYNLEDKLRGNLALFFGMGIYSLLNFFVQKYLVFKKKD